jgi:hypothetical protein
MFSRADPVISSEVSKKTERFVAVYDNVSDGMEVWSRFVRIVICRLTIDDGCSRASRWSWRILGVVVTRCLVSHH